MPAGDASILFRFLSFIFAVTVIMPIFETTIIIPGMIKLTVAELNIQLAIQFEIQVQKKALTRLRKMD